MFSHFSDPEFISLRKTQALYLLASRAMCTVTELNNSPSLVGKVCFSWVSACFKVSRSNFSIFWTVFSWFITANWEIKIGRKQWSMPFVHFLFMDIPLKFIIILFACSVTLHAFLSSVDFLFLNELLQKKSFRYAIRVSRSLDLDQAQHFAGPNLGPNCLQRLSADNKKRH